MNNLNDIDTTPAFDITRLFLIWIPLIILIVLIVLTIISLINKKFKKALILFVGGIIAFILAYIGSYYYSMINYVKIAPAYGVPADIDEMISKNS